MASYTKTKNGRWKVQLSIKGQRPSKTFDTKAEGKSWAASQEVELGGRGEVADFHTLAELFERYRDEVSSDKKGERWERIRLNKFCTYSIANKRLAKLDLSDFQEWVDMRIRSVKASSVNRELNLMSHCLTQARRWKWMAHNPMQDLQRPKDPPHRDRLIPQDEIDLILAALGYSDENPVSNSDQRVAAAFLFAIETAMRAGEICCLTDCRVDLSASVAELRPGDTKTGAGRKVPLSKKAVSILNSLPDVDEGKPLFGLKSSVLSTKFLSARKRAGIEGLTFHDTRHEATTRLAQKLPVLDLARVTGHKDIKQLMTYYNKSASDLVELLD